MCRRILRETKGDRRMMDSLYIVIPAYNEEENIERCVLDWYKVLDRYGDDRSRLVIVNDGSKDRTFEKLKELALDRPKLVPVSKPNGGHGSAVLSGYRYAIEHGADWIFQTDSDGQTDPGGFAAFWENRKRYDAILGNRVVRGDGKDRKFIENTVCFLLRLIFGVKVRDANAPFRLMKTNLVAKYINKLPADYNLPNIMFTTYFVYFREKVLFLPITFQPREKGTNSLNLRKIVKIGRNAVKDFRRFRKEI